MGYSTGMKRGPEIVRWRGVGFGFSLIELLVAVVIILILTTLYWSPNTASHQRGLQNACQKNLQKVHVALEIYAADWGGKFPNVPGVRTSSAALDVLVPRYTSDTASLICPGSSDSDLAAGVSIARKKISYAYYMGRSLSNAQQVVMSDKQVDAQAKNAGQLGFSTTGKPPGNNHGKFGGNFLFGDGHVELSRAHAAFALPLNPGEVLLNP
jgi:prepilin-type N-terminal cleavage/methylation domain-containing protein/prepilin-type processing-associated H-X9-DG protein